MYSKIEELPTEVRNSFDAEDAKRWMDEYNKLSKDDDTDTARIKAWRACMNLPSSFSFKIMASVEDVDADGELITLDTIRDNLDSYIREGGKVQQAHSNYQIATIWDYEDAICPETGKPGIAVYGNVFGGDGDNIEYTKAREDFKNGQNSLSVGGDASYEGYECNEDQCFVRRNMEELMEISLCHTPANPYAKLIWYNDKAVVKSKDDVALKVTDVEIHKSYDECSYMAVARMIQKATDIPFSYRTSHFGCAVKTEDETGLMDVMDSLRLHYDYDIKKGEFIVRSLEDELHRVFKRGMKEGWLNPDYTIGDCPAPYFLSMVDRGLIVKADSERWKLNADILKDGGAMTAGNAGSNGAFNARYSDRDKAIITFEEIMDWKSRITKMNVQMMDADGMLIHADSYFSLSQARDVVKRELQDLIDRSSPEELAGLNGYGVTLMRYDSRTGTIGDALEEWYIFMGTDPLNPEPPRIMRNTRVDFDI